jgi:hypothetical protein
VFPSQNEYVVKDDVVYFEFPEEMKAKWTLHTGSNVLEDIFEQRMESSKGASPQKIGSLFGTKQPSGGINSYGRKDSVSAHSRSESIMKHAHLQKMLSLHQKQIGYREFKDLPEDKQKKMPPTSEALDFLRTKSSP